MQKIKDLVEVFNGYYEQRDVKVAVAKKDFVTAIKAAKLLPTGTKYEEEKKTELIKLLGGMTSTPVEEVTSKTDIPTDANPEPIDDNENTQGPTEVNPEPIDDNENTQGPTEVNPEPIESEAAPITDPVEQIVEASEVAETIESEAAPAEEVVEATPAEEMLAEKVNEEIAENIESSTDLEAAPVEDVIEEPTSSKKRRK